MVLRLSHYPMAAKCVQYGILMLTTEWPSSIYKPTTHMQQGMGENLVTTSRSFASDPATILLQFDPRSCPC